MPRFQVYAVPKDNGLAEREPRLRAVPFDEFLDRVPVASLSVDRTGMQVKETVGCPSLALRRCLPKPFYQTVELNEVQLVALRRSLVRNSGLFAKCLLWFLERGVRHCLELGQEPLVNGAFRSYVGFAPSRYCPQLPFRKSEAEHSTPTGA